MCRVAGAGRGPAGVEEDVEEHQGATIACVAGTGQKMDRAQDAALTNRGTAKSERENRAAAYTARRTGCQRGRRRLSASRLRTRPTWRGSARPSSGQPQTRSCSRPTAQIRRGVICGCGSSRSTPRPKAIRHSKPLDDASLPTHGA
jgi:hypothetical protein